LAVTSSAFLAPVTVASRSIGPDRNRDRFYDKAGVIMSVILHA